VGKHEEKIQAVFEAIRELMKTPECQWLLSLGHWDNQSSHLGW
jgi:hypothetical protein